MITLPGSVLWFFLLVYLACGQILDNDSFDTYSTGLDETERTINNTKIQSKEEEQRNQTLEPDSGGGGGDGEEDDKEQIEANSKPIDPLINKTATTRPRTLSGRSQDFNRSDSSDYSKSRNTGRRASQRTVTLFNSTGIPSMSPERRNSYLSIAERRKYYNRTRVQTKKPEPVDVELEHQETMNQLMKSTTEILLANEIRVNKNSGFKESGRAVTDRKTNQTNGQRVFVSFPSNETTPKPQITRQSVIQSQYQFGQKLNSRKPATKSQEVLEERLNRKNEKTKIESVFESSTNRLQRNYPTQSTKLIKVDKSLWVTTKIPDSDVDVDNFVMSTFGNGTDIKKLEKYETANDTGFELLSKKAVPPSVHDNQVMENGNQTKVPPPVPIARFIPLSLDYGNTTVAYTVEEDNSDEAKKLASNVRNVYNQEIFRLNSTRKTLKFQSKVAENSSEILTKALETTTVASLNISKFFQSNLTNIPNTLNSTTLTTASTPTTTTTTTGQPINHSYTTELSKTPLAAKNGKPSNNENSHVMASASLNRTDINYKGNDDVTRTKTPLVRVIPKESSNTSHHAIPTVRISPVNVGNVKKEISLGIESKNRKNSSRLLPSVPEVLNTTEEYPLTIELNENNKRVLSEMFHTSTVSEPKKGEKGKSTTGKPGVEQFENVTSASKDSTTISTTTAQSPQVMSPEESHNESQDEDHKAMGTRYNTKFYISPNVSRNHVIKVVEHEDDDDDDDDDGSHVTLPSGSAGVAVYVLAAFGLVPLLLALLFATRIVIQRQRRQYECESDAKSDISGNECQTRGGRKKGFTDLKKSPSNVTTTTLVTTTRLPRVQHWDSCEKQGAKNWEFPRSKLKLKTILGQGNFGQVWKAEAEDMSNHEGISRLVAVKTVKEGATERERSEFIKELEIMQQIGSHPNIVTLLGCCTDQEPYYLIMEYVKYGKLLTYLREHRVNESYYNFSNNSDALTSRDLTVFAYCVARGMEYLVSRGIIHRDLAARNVLVDHAKLCKIADFGMSRSVRDFEDGQVYEERQHRGALPIRWMAPESLVYSVFTYKSDVWSFGILMWEIVTLGSTPYPNMGAREVMRRVRDGYRLERPSHCNPEFYRLISHCWSHDPNKRPDFSELKHELSNLLDNPTKDGSYVDLDRFAVDNNFHVSSKTTNDFRLLERGDFKSLKRLGDWNTEDWPEEAKKCRIKRGRNNGKGTVTLTGQGSFTVNSRILEKEFKMI